MRTFRFLFLFAFAAIISSCTPGTGTIDVTLEADGTLPAEDAKSLETIYRERLLKFGIDDDNIVITTTGNRIKVQVTERSNYENPELGRRLKKLLQSSAGLGFWETYETTDVLSSIVESLVVRGDSGRADSSLYIEFFKHVGFPPQIFEGSSSFGYVKPADTAVVNAILASPDVRKALPPDLVFGWTPAKSYGQDSPALHELILLKSKRGKAAMEFPEIVEAKVETTEYSASPQISFTMDKADGEIWRRLTKENTGKNVAIVLDGIVYSCPRVQSEISGGSASITGDFTKAEADDLATILQAGHLPVRMRIVEYNETK